MIPEETVSAGSLTPLNTKPFIDFLGDYEDICETALGRESGPWVWLIDKKTEGRKSRVTVPLEENSQEIIAKANLRSANIF
jgi:hypothetical protein